MCYNCGCGMPDDDMGQKKLMQGGGSLTEDDFRHMAKQWGMTLAETKKNVYELLKKQVGQNGK